MRAPSSVMLFALKSRNVIVVLTVSAAAKCATLSEVIELYLSARCVSVELTMSASPNFRAASLSGAPPIPLQLRLSVVIAELHLRPLANSSTDCSSISIPETDQIRILK